MLDPVKKRLTVEVAGEMVKAEVESAYEKLAKTASIAGFRQGKVPRDVLRQKFEGRILSEKCGLGPYRADISRGPESS